MRSGGSAGLRSGLAWEPLSALFSSRCRRWSGSVSGAPGSSPPVVHTRRCSMPSLPFTRCTSSSASPRSVRSRSARSCREGRRGARCASGACSGTSWAWSGWLSTLRFICSDHRRIADMSCKALLLVGCAVASIVAAGCKGYRTQGFKEPMKLGGKTIPASVLTEGERAYVLHCRACHGDKGDGKGPAAPGVRPPPRDFTLGSFKFGAVPGGTLPNDDDLVRVVRFGLHGTAMRAWDGVPEKNLLAIIQYVKTFSPRWKDEEPGEPIAPTPDPWQSKEAPAVERGRALYHGMANCLSCHPAYAPKRYIYEVS